MRAVFPCTRAHGEGRGATLERSGWSEDPRELFPAIELFLGWVLDARAERRAEAPYR